MNVEPQANDLDNRVAENVGRLMASDGGGALSPSASRGSFARLERRLVTHRRRVRGMQAALGVSLVLMVAGVGYQTRSRWLSPGEDVLSFHVENGPSLGQGAPIEARADAPATDVTFSDGTRIRMEPQARGRVLNLDQLGARVELDRGRAHVDVRHRPQARWSFQAGPFEVRVTGTAFSLAWDPVTAHFDLHMESGVVSVAGPISGGEMVLRAGETLSVGLRDPEVVPRPVAANGPTAAAAPLEPTIVPLDEEVPVPALKRHVKGSARAEHARPAKDWREELANGRAAAVVADARRRGLDRVLESVSSEDLAALADAARYVGNDELARRTLLAQRQRFPGSARAAQASFLLGRLEDETMGSTSRALGWYDRYLAEAPHGTYVSEALGRKMMVLEGAHRRDEAMSIASDYLHRFPTGSYAHAARALVRTARAPSEAPSPRP